MRGADEAAARQQANRILDRLRQRPLFFGGEPRTVTVTIGVATCRNGSADTLFQRADLALYAGKTAGRDRVVCDTEIAADQASP
jgi:PleD family two-component response regulator